MCRGERTCGLSFGNRGQFFMYITSTQVLVVVSQPGAVEEPLQCQWPRLVTNVIVSPTLKVF